MWGFPRCTWKPLCLETRILSVTALRPTISKREKKWVGGRAQGGEELNSRQQGGGQAEQHLKDQNKQSEKESPTEKPGFIISFPSGRCGESITYHPPGTERRTATGNDQRTDQKRIGMGPSPDKTQEGNQRDRVPILLHSAAHR